MKKVSNQKRAQRVEAHLKQVNLFAAGIDIGSRSHFVAVPPDIDEEPVREFAGFTGDLHRMADWLVELGIQTVAMESTGVYWIPVYERSEKSWWWGEKISPFGRNDIVFGHTGRNYRVFRRREGDVYRDGGMDLAFGAMKLVSRYGINTLRRASRG